MLVLVQKLLKNIFERYALTKNISISQEQPLLIDYS